MPKTDSRVLWNLTFQQKPYRALTIPYIKYSLNILVHISVIQLQDKVLLPATDMMQNETSNSRIYNFPCRNYFKKQD